MKRKSLSSTSNPLLFAALLAGVSMAAHAQEPANCPAAIAGLMPSNAVKASCQYNSAGMVGMGAGAADLPFKNICANQTTPNPGKITFELKHYGGEMAEMFKMQIGPEEQQRDQLKQQEYQKNYQKLQANKSPQVVSITPFKTETAGSGSMSSWGYERDCSEGEKRSKPIAYVHAVAHTHTTAIDLEVTGNISVDAAKAAATEVLNNFAKANFNSLDK